MFQESEIALLRNRLGWSQYEKELYVNKLDTTNLTSTSGLTLNSFHNLVTVENVFKLIPESNISDVRLNGFLTEMLDTTIIEILNDVLISDSRSAVKKDNASIIVDYGDTGLFDTAIGNCHAIKVIELILSSNRSNREEILAKTSVGQIQAILKGTYTKDGNKLVDGLIHKCANAREEIKTILYGSSKGDAVICDGTNEW